MTELCTMEDMLSTLEDDVSHRTGRALKQRREAAGLSLRMLAERSGISSSMISDIERGAKSPTVVTVVRLAQALGVGAAALIDGEEAPASRIRVLRRGEGTSGATPAPWETLGPATPGSRIDFTRLRIPPATALAPSPAHGAGTIEHVHVATGRLRVRVGEETAELSAGDSCSCRTDVAHGIENIDPAEEATLYVILERG